MSDQPPDFIAAFRRVCAETSSDVSNWTIVELIRLRKYYPACNKLSAQQLKRKIERLAEQEQIGQ